MGKRKRKSRDDFDRRLEKLEKMLYKRSRRNSSTCDEESSSDSRSRSRSLRVNWPSRARSRCKSRRYLASSPSPSPTDNSNDLVEETGGGPIEESVPSGEAAVSGEVATPTLPADIEGLLGLEGASKVSNGIELHEGLKQRWMAILQNGLTEDTKSSLIKKYDPPKNCCLLVPPKLNAEVAAAMNESGVKRDKRIADQQTVLAAAISAIGKVLNDMVSSSQSNAEIETLSNSARLLCGLYHSNTETRRSLILPGLNKDVKDTMTQSLVSEYLFGDKLQDKVNACKAVKKSAEDLKNTPAQKLPIKKALNFKGPQRFQLPRPSGQKQKLRQPAYQSTKPSQARRSPQRQRHSRRQDQRRR